MLYPTRVVKIVPYFWNERCLKAPRPFMIEGCYAIDPVRRVRPGLVTVSQGFIGHPTAKEMTASVKAYLDRLTF